MPINVGYFSIRQPRVSPINAQTTVAPSSEGTFALKDGFTINYTGSASTCYLYVTGKSILTLCDEDYQHTDNLDLPNIGQTIEEISNAINSQANYSTTLLSSTPDDLGFLEGEERFDLSSSSYTVRYNSQKEYLIDVHTQGKLNQATVNIKTEQFQYAGQYSRWMINEGYIHEQINEALDSNGKVAVGTDGVVIDFEPSYNPNANDLSNVVNFEDIELVYFLDQPIASTVFQAAPILIDGTLELKINQKVAEEGIEYRIDYGTLPELKASTQAPYTFTSTSNILRIRWNSDDVQEFNLGVGTFTSFEVANVINNTASNFTAIGEVNEAGQEFLILRGNRGTAYHQLRIEDGSANSVFGFTDFLAKKGSGSGQLLFMTYIEDEDHTPLADTDTFTANAIFTATANPFLGIDTENFRILENNIELENGEDFIVAPNGTVNLVDIYKDQNMIGATLKLDNELFPPDYYIYDNGVSLVEGDDFSINRQGGWITLEESAFPGHVFKATYTNKVIGIIEDEVILGGQAEMEGTERGPYSISASNNVFKVSVNNDPYQEFVFEQNLGTSTTNAVALINATATGFVAYNNNETIVLKTIESGPTYTLKIGDGTANAELGFTNNQSEAGYGAEGGERALEVSNAPMDKTGFTAPIGGDTIIIKNNDVTERYKRDTVIKLVNDYYQVENSIIEERANLISSTPGPYTILSESNDTFTFSIDDEEPVTVTFDEGNNIDIATIVSQINVARPSTARIVRINGQEKIQLLGTTKVSIGNGLANRTIGFDDGDEDTDIPDTFIKIIGLFRTTYVAPDMFTTIKPIPFTVENAIRLEVPSNTTNIKFLGDLTSRYKANIFVRIGGLYYYKVLSSTFEDGITTVTVHNKIDAPIFEDTSIGFTELTIYEEGDVDIRTLALPLLDQPFALRKNGDLLTVDLDYTIIDNGNIELTEGLRYGDQFLIDYTGRRYIGAGTSLFATYSYFDFLKVGTNLKYSLQAVNSDNFFVNVLHGSTILARTTEDLVTQTQTNLNPNSSGFPTGQIPTQENDESGSSTFNYTIGDLEDKIEVSNKIFEFYDKRLQYFEEERQAINGYIVGAEDGRIALQDIEDGATQDPPQRLFPLPDNRPPEERTEPLRVPALDGLNQNDAGSSANGTASSYLIIELNNERSELLQEKTKLQDLITRSTTSNSIISTGDVSLLDGEEIILYIEVANPPGSSSNIIQNNVTITMPGPTSGGGGVGGGTTTPDASDVVSAINSAVNSAFGLSVNPASVSGANVSLNATSGSYCKCAYVIQDTPNLGFGVGNEASLRSRRTLYTAGAVYSFAVPGGDSVHTDINTHLGFRSAEDTRHGEQIDNLNGQMREWLAPYDIAFPKAKDERARAETAVSESVTFSGLSTAFRDSKFGTGTFTSINSNTTINDRISDIDSRVADIDRRLTELSNRLTEISNTLNDESLYEPRFSWVVLLADKSSGFYATKDREIVLEEKRKREAANNAQAVESLGNL